MRPTVKTVQANSDYTLSLLFDNGEKRIFDVKPYLDGAGFLELRDMRLFKTVKICDDTIQWIHDQDFCPDTLYLESKAMGSGTTLVGSGTMNKT